MIIIQDDILLKENCSWNTLFRMEFIYPPYKRKEKIPLNNLFLGRYIRKFVHLIFEKYLIFINHKPQKKKYFKFIDLFAWVCVSLTVSMATR